jgi:hypothetical protein
MEKPHGFEWSNVPEGGSEKELSREAMREVLEINEEEAERVKKLVNSYRQGMEEAANNQNEVGLTELCDQLEQGLDIIRIQAQEKIQRLMGDAGPESLIPEGAPEASGSNRNSEGGADEESSDQSLELGKLLANLSRGEKLSKEQMRAVVYAIDRELGTVENLIYSYKSGLEAALNNGDLAGFKENNEQLQDSLRRVRRQSREKLWRR